MKNVILITTEFPYSVGEPFLETEVQYYKNYENIKFKIMPSHGAKLKRAVDSSIEIDDYLIYSINNKKRLVYSFVKSLFCSFFYKEILAHNLFNIKKLKVFGMSIVKQQFYYDIFDSYFKDKKDLEDTVIYTYWNTEITYALQRLKYKYPYKLVSRIHRGDIYQEERVLNYMPLKAQFIKDIDTIYTITKSANDYLHKTYGFDYKTLELSRLGVEDNNIISEANRKNILHIASCSSLVEVKQVDRIIDSLSILAKQMPHIEFRWTHIGSGNLEQLLLVKAGDKLGDLENVNFYFKGHLKNQEVFQLYKDIKIDVFLNVSKSEGVPVSIMEAMSCHIPIVAPNVGGIADMVLDGESGYLLSNKCQITEIVNALRDIEFYKNKKTRDKSYEIFLDKYYAKKNYEGFLDKITAKIK